MNKKIRMLMLILCLCMVFTGCQGNIAKTPDNFDEDLWGDSIKVINIIYDTIKKEDNFSVGDEKIIEELNNALGVSFGLEE